MFDYHLESNWESMRRALFSAFLLALSGQAVVASIYDAYTMQLYYWFAMLFFAILLVLAVLPYCVVLFLCCAIGKVVWEIQRLSPKHRARVHPKVIPKVIPK